MNMASAHLCHDAPPTADSIGGEDVYTVVKDDEFVRQNFVGTPFLSFSPLTSSSRRHPFPPFSFPIGAIGRQSRVGRVAACFDEADTFC